MYRKTEGLKRILCPKNSKCTLLKNIAKGVNDGIEVLNVGADQRPPKENDENMLKKIITSDESIVF